MLIISCSHTTPAAAAATILPSPPPIHMNATIIDLYVHPLEEGEYCVLYQSNEKPYRQGYYAIG